MECSTNIVTANFGGGKREATTAPLYEWDYGQVLCITGLDALPQTFEVHFAIQKKGSVSTTVVGIDGRVDIPNVLLTIGKDIHAWIYLSDSTGDGETEYAITIPVKARPMPEYYDAEVTGEFDGVVRQVGEYAEEATAAAERAATSATAAAQSATAAAASESAAAESAAAAETAAQDADTAKGQAETAAQTATEKAQQTAQDAAQAASDAGRAESAAQSAETAQIGAENAKTDAETAAQGAAASASAASESATSAGQAATSAAQSATAAAGSATTAQGAAQTATTKAGEASASATAAAASETAAQTAQTAAEAAETNAGQSASTATAKAAEAVQSASGAAQSKTDAEAAAARAEQAAASLTVDTALSDTSTNPVQNKVITGELTDVKSALTDSTGNVIYSFTKGGYITNNGSTVDISAVTNNGAYAYIVVDCNEGDLFTLSGQASSTQRLYAFAGAESGGTRPILAKAVAYYTADEEQIIAPAGAKKLIVNALVASKYALFKGKLIKTVWSELEDSTEALQTEIGYLRHANADVTTQFSVTTGKYCSAGSASLGNLNTDADCYATDYIKVYPGSVIKASNVYLYGARGICAYRADKTVISALASNSGTLNSVDVAITIPEDATYIRATGKTANGMCSFEYLSSVIPGADSIRPEYTDVTATATDGKYVSANSGGIPNDTGACASAFIRVRPYAHIIASGLYLTGVRSICAYDKNHDFLRAIISNTSDTTYEFDVDPDVYYIRATGLVGVPPTIKMSLPDVDDTKHLYSDVSILIPYNHRKSVCRKIVTYVDDDALDEAGMDLLKQSCDTLGIKCSIAAVSKILESTPSRVTYLKGLESEGFHICNHTYDHSRWYSDYDGQAMFTLAEVEQDLIKSIRVLDGFGFIDASRFLIYPGSSYNRAGITEVTKKWTELACTISSGNNRIENVPRSWLYRCHIDALTHPDLAYYQSQLTDLTVEDGNNWVIYYSHCKTFDESGEWTQALFEGVMQNALDNGYTAMTLNEAWRYRKAMWLAQEAFGV